jgi:hypothetical protein
VAKFADINSTILETFIPNSKYGHILRKTEHISIPPIQMFALACTLWQIPAPGFGTTATHKVSLFISPRHNNIHITTVDHLGSYTGSMWLFARVEVT